MSNLLEYEIRPMKIEELERALELIYNVFMEFEAPDFWEEGVKTFVEFLDFNSIKNKIEDDNLNFFGCYDKEKLVGVIATRQVSHIVLLFVDKNYHRKGIGRKLFETVLSAVEDNFNINEITINSSPYAVEFYHKLGFQDTDSEQLVDGIRFTPMKFEIA
ncbi:GNAT family N-acetyltransferase [Oceanirhabdus sp. W0125-5]|uniref:GNAT family N-acetyltransferase n=1 Tax=Oceanirhabdus sp. W0125-5 TaxID=2999116 RepID=UPI0022F31CF4|nr:GNAT family N-acetyltransferase [Oceanirhabdus sp. W0125-5]WBW96327.1 GNAT family N-acetyltransferase [Oceanirhabdus sp. W0125-5]